MGGWIRDGGWPSEEVRRALSMEGDPAWGEMWRACGAAERAASIAAAVAIALALGAGLLLPL